MKQSDFLDFLEQDHPPLFTIVSGYKNKRLGIRKIGRMYGIDIAAGSINPMLYDSLAAAISGWPSKFRPEDEAQEDKPQLDDSVDEPATPISPTYTGHGSW